MVFGKPRFIDLCYLLDTNTFVMVSLLYMFFYILSKPEITMALAPTQIPDMGYRLYIVIYAHPGNINLYSVYKFADQNYACKVHHENR